MRHETRRPTAAARRGDRSRKPSDCLHKERAAFTPTEIEIDVHASSWLHPCSRLHRDDTALRPRDAAALGAHVARLRRRAA